MLTTSHVMNITLRPALAADYAVIASWISNAQACLRWAGPQLNYPFDIVRLAEQLKKPESKELALLDQKDNVVGFAQYWKRDSLRVHLGRIIVAPMSRGLGYGKILCEALLTRAQSDTGLPVVSLRVYRDNLAAQALYRQLGFVEVAADSNTEVMAMEYGSQAH